MSNNHDQRSEATANWLEFRKEFSVNAEGAKRAALIVCGGAAVAFLTFLGTASSTLSTKPEAMLDFAFAMQLYLWSITSCLVMFAFSFFSQAGYNEANHSAAESRDQDAQRFNKVGFVCASTAVFFGFAAVVLFVIGSFFATVGFEHFAGDASKQVCP